MLAMTSSHTNLLPELYMDAWPSLLWTHSKSTHTGFMSVNTHCPYFCLDVKHIFSILGTDNELEGNSLSNLAK